MRLSILKYPSKMGVLVCSLKVVALGLLFSVVPVNSMELEYILSNRTVGNSASVLDAPDSSVVLYNISQLDNLMMPAFGNAMSKNTSESLNTSVWNHKAKLINASNMLPTGMGKVSEKATLLNNANYNIYKEEGHAVSGKDVEISKSTEKMAAVAAAENELAQKYTVENKSDTVTRTVIKSEMQENRHNSQSDTEARAIKTPHTEHITQNLTSGAIFLPIEATSSNSTKIELKPTDFQAFFPENVNSNEDEFAVLETSESEEDNETEDFTTIPSPTNYDFSSFSNTINFLADVHPLENVTDSTETEENDSFAITSQDQTFPTVHYSLGSSSPTAESTFDTAVETESNTTQTNGITSAHVEVETSTNKDINPQWIAETIQSDMLISSESPTAVASLPEYTLTAAGDDSQASSKPSILVNSLHESTETDVFTEEQIYSKPITTDYSLHESTVTSVNINTHTFSIPVSTDTPFHESTVTNVLGDTVTSSKPLVADIPLQESILAAVDADAQSSSKPLTTHTLLQESAITTILPDTQTSSKPSTTNISSQETAITTTLADIQTTSKPSTTDIPSQEPTVTTIRTDIQASSKPLTTDIPLEEPTITTILTDTQTTSNPSTTDIPSQETTVTTIILTDTQTTSKPSTTDIPSQESTITTILTDTQTSSNPSATDIPSQEPTITVIPADTQTSSKPSTTDFPSQESTITILSDTQTSSKPLPTDIPSQEPTITILTDALTSSKPLTTDTPSQELTVTPILVDTQTSSKPSTTDIPSQEHTATITLAGTQTSNPLTSGTVLQTEFLTEAVSSLGITNVTTAVEIGIQHLAPTTEAVTPSITSTTSTGFASEVSTLKPSQGAEEVFKCRKRGIFADPNDCVSYHICQKAFYWNLHFKKRCWFGFQFHSTWKICVPPKFSDCSKRFRNLVDGNEQNRNR